VVEGTCLFEGLLELRGLAVVVGRLADQRHTAVEHGRDI
jgi:hypothetical protein